MNVFYEEEKEQLTELERFMLSKSNTKLEKWEMYADFLERMDKDEEMVELLSMYDSADITTAWVGLHSKYFNKIKYPKTTHRLYDYEFVGYNEHKLLQLTKDSNIIIMTNSIAVKFSKTAWTKFNKFFTFEDITRLRLYQMYHNHKREDDDFLGLIKDNKISYFILDTIDPAKFLQKYPEISI